jgi:hypothetical protein
LVQQIVIQPLVLRAIIGAEKIPPPNVLAFIVEPMTLPAASYWRYMTPDGVASEL